MTINREIHHIIQKIFKDVKGYLESDQVQVNCPICQERENLFAPDGKFNLEINTEKRVFKCWKCADPEFKGSLGYLIKKYGSYNDFNTYKAFYCYYDENTNNFEEENLTVYLPQEFISFNNIDISNPLHMEAYSYLILERKLNKELIKKYDIGFCIDGRYKNRIIIPSYDKFGNLNYFIARTWDKNERNKYDNPKINKFKIIFNESNINWNSTVFLVEGGFDMLSMPYNTIPLLGKKIGIILFNKLKLIKPNIIVILDPDAYKENIELIQELKNIYIDCEEKVRIVELPRKNKEFDLDKINLIYGKNEIIKLLYTARDLNVDDLFMKKISSYTGNSKNYKYKKYNKSDKFQNI